MTTSTANYLAEKADNGEAAEYSISIAAELRRLHEVNAELLLALKAIVGVSQSRLVAENPFWLTYAKAAIKKAEA